MLEVYREFAENVLAIPVLVGRKSEKEKFAGAQATYGMEAMMLDGKSLQAGTSHYFGDNFSKAFEIKFASKEGDLKYVYQTSWGTSTRMIGALIMAHGDNRGLALPPKVAPVQAIIIPIAAHKGGVNEKAEEIKTALENAGVRVEVDYRDQSTGWKFNEWEMKGVPVRIEVGPRDIENGVVTVARRDDFSKTQVKIEDLTTEIPALLDTIQKNMLEKARKFRDAHIVVCEDMDGLTAAVNSGNFVKAMWCGEQACEDEIKEKYSATSRCMPFDQTPIGDVCVCCGKPAKKLVYWGKAY